MGKEASSGWGGPTGHFFDSDIGSVKTNASARLEEFYTVELLDRVAQVYAADLKAFNYTHFYHSIRSRLLQKQGLS